jgi:hypothetical protein
MGWSTAPAAAVDSRPITTIIGNELASTAQPDWLLASSRECVDSEAVESAGLALWCRRNLRKRLAILSVLPSVSRVPPDASTAGGEL